MNDRMKRFASHLIFIPSYGYLQYHVVELADGHVEDLFPMTGESENVEWLPGAIVLVTAEEFSSLEQGAWTDSFFVQSHLSAASCLPSGIWRQRLSLYYPRFNVMAMQPACGIRHRQLK